MRRRTRTLWFLSALVAVLGAAVYAQLRHERSLVAEPLTAIDPAAVRSVAVACQGCTSRRFEKRDGRWRMLEPYAQDADAEAVDKLVAIATAPVRYRHAAGALDPKKLGLDPPLASLLLDGVALRFGTTDAIHGDRYVEVDGTVALVPDRFSARLFAAPENELASPPPASP
ncbi:hypothetical protein [Dokdonella sp.]|uniref:hypothetical protein n=1 Tax=Dokdonella sp. TaxID=2291710 RepID=UPI001B1099E2|nr:hypothetical protein [Dokdonella sp.]MBO9661330.1 hypothetical protein [Dokdonella sp.]